MGFIARLLSFVRTERNGAQISDVKIDPGGGANVTAQHFSSPGDDSFPIDSDYVHAAQVPGSWRHVAIGYADPVNEPKAQKGEKRIYGRDTNGTAINEVWLKADGSVLVNNDNGSFLLRADGSQKGQNSQGSYELEKDGDFVVNGATITKDGDFLDSSGRTLRTHKHPQGNDSGGNTEQDTGPATTD